MFEHGHSLITRNVKLHTVACRHIQRKHLRIDLR